MEEPKYKCAECGIAVIILDGEIIRPCPHKDAAVTADCSAVVYGESKLEE